MHEVPGTAGLSRATRKKVTAAGVIAASVIAVLGVLFAVRTKPVPRTVRVALDETNQFEKTRINGRPVGLTVDVMEEAARRQGIQILWIDSRGTSEDGLLKGLTDVWPNMARTPERERLFHFTKPYLRRDFCLVSLDTHLLLTPRECAGHKVGLVNGSFTKALAAKFLPDANRVILPSRAKAITALCQGEVEATFSESSFFNAVMLARPPECGSLRFQMIPLHGPAIETGLASKPENADMAEALRDGIESMRLDGTFMRLLANQLPSAVSENEILLQEQQARNRMSRLTALVSGVTVLLLILVWQNRRVSRARSLTNQANTSLQQSIGQLREAHQRLSAQVNRMPLACIVLDIGHRVREWNPAAESIFGWSVAEAKGKTLEELLLPPGTTGDAAWVDCVAEGDGGHEQEVVAKGGHVLVCEWLSTPLRDDSGQMTAVLSLAQDITARRRMEEDLRQAHKLESIGRLAGGVAHDFNNLLTVINGHAELILGELPQDAPERQGIEEILQAGGRAAELTQHLLAFSRKQILQPKPLDLNSVIVKNSGIFSRLLGERIELHVLPAKQRGLVMADEGQIHRVLMNLLANARDAMPEGGIVTLATANVEAAAEGTDSGRREGGGSSVELTVADTGVGMDRETLERVFEPFFTTKGRATATGLGLPMVHGVVRQSGGTIDVFSNPGQGTTFRIRLPRIGVPAGASPQEDKPKALYQGRETILVVEDQEGVRKFATALLKQHGYTVLQAPGGVEAIRIAESESRLDLLLTDVVMPGMSGPEVAAEVCKHKPGIGILYMSGYGSEAGDLPAGTPMISKPFTTEELLCGIQSALVAKGKQ